MEYKIFLNGKEIKDFLRARLHIDKNKNKIEAVLGMNNNYTLQDIVKKDKCFEFYLEIKKPETGRWKE